jgi:DsbC/DsbD-like thiol-disulfide interchange protein
MLADALRYDGRMLFLLLLLTADAPAMQRPTDVVKWSAVASPASARAGDTVKVSLTASIENGWKLYALTQPDPAAHALKIAVVDGAPVTILTRQIVGPDSKVYADASLGMNVRYHDKRATFVVPVKLSTAAKPGKLRIPLRVTFQSCTDNICLLPFTSPVDVDVEVRK